MMVGEAFGIAASDWARFARTTCPECSAPVVWVGADRLTRLVKAEDRERAEEVRGFAGQGADAWVCANRDCRNWGVFFSEEIFLP